MTSNSRVQHLLHVSQRSSKSSGWGVVIGIALLGVFLSASAQAAIFTVNSPADVVAQLTQRWHLRDGVPYYGAGQRRLHAAGGH